MAIFHLLLFPQLPRSFEQKTLFGVFVEVGLKNDYSWGFVLWFLKLKLCGIDPAVVELRFTDFSTYLVSSSKFSSLNNLVCPLLNYFQICFNMKFDMFLSLFDCYSLNLWLAIFIVIIKSHEKWWTILSEQFWFYLLDYLSKCCWWYCALYDHNASIWFVQIS